MSRRARHTAYCRTCERSISTLARPAAVVKYIRCSECGTPVPPEGAVGPGIEGRT